MNISNINLGKLFEKLFDEYEKLLPEYVLMNKYDTIPNELPSDLDFSISQEHFDLLDNIIPEIAKACKLAVVQKIWHGYRKCAYILSPLDVTEPFRLQLDFFTDFSVKNTPLLIPNDIILKSTRKYGRYTVPSYDLEYIFLCLRRIYKNDFDKEKLIPIRSALLNEPEKCKKAAKKLWGEALGKQMAEAILDEDVETLQRFRNALWEKTRLKSKENSSASYFLKFWKSQIIRYFYRIKYPVGISIAFLAPDGGGKSTAIELVKKLSWGAFHGNIELYFRPHLLSNAGAYKPYHKTIEEKTNFDPHGKEPNGLLKSIARFFFYNLDFILGTWFKVDIMKIKKNLVIFDRYYYDYYADMKRYQYSLSPNFARAFAWSIPKPDLIFVLDAPADILYARKQELTLEEIERQRRIYRHFSERELHAVLVDASRSPEEVARQITKTILRYKAKQTAKLLHCEVDEEGYPVR